MPQAFDHVPWQTDHTKILERPELDRIIALISVLWNLVEENITRLASSMLGKPEMMAITPVEAIFREIIDYKLRLNLIEAIARMRLSKEMHNEFVDIAKRAKDLGSKRAKYIHGKWAMSPDIKDGLILVPGSHQWKTGWGKKPPKFMVYKEQDFVDTEKKLQEFNDLLLDFLKRCLIALGRAHP